MSKEMTEPDTYATFTISYMHEATASTLEHVERTLFIPVLSMLDAVALVQEIVAMIVMEPGVLGLEDSDEKSLDFDNFKIGLNDD